PRAVPQRSACGNDRPTLPRASESSVGCICDLYIRAIFSISNLYGQRWHKALATYGAFYVTSPRRSSITNAADISRRTPHAKQPIRCNGPFAVLRDVAAVIAAALGTIAGINLLLLLLHVGPD